jgi:ABC-type nitrate/sulfonate/bicarbonate transport system permease component
MNTHQASAQTSLITTAKKDIVDAFQAIQTAEQKGVTNSDIAPLISQLNLALQFEVNASTFESQNNATAANNDALQSINLATTVTLQAQQLGDAAQTATTTRTVSAYVIAVLVAIGSAVVVVESPRFMRSIRNRRLRNARIESGGKQDAK